MIMLARAETIPGRPKRQPVTSRRHAELVQFGHPDSVGTIHVSRQCNRRITRNIRDRRHDQD